MLDIVLSGTDGFELMRDVVKRLCRKLRDYATDHTYIITEPRVGYRMAVGETAEP